MHELQRTVKHIPSILVLTADGSVHTKHRALSEGANDFLSKPFNQAEVLLRTANLLKAQRDRSMLGQIVNERTKELERSQLETIQRLARAAEYRDDECGSHPERLGALSALIAEALGHDSAEVELIRQAAPLHDVGKIGISESILHKRGRLTPLEFETMKQHTLIGMSIMSGSPSPVLQLAAKIAEQHHEFWNGNGYWGWQGDDIHIVARIVAVADAFDSLTHDKPYRPTMSVEEALEEIKQMSGAQFDPTVVRAFLTLDHFEFMQRKP
jgi:putative two-component system response regulator